MSLALLRKLYNVTGCPKSKMAADKRGTNNNSNIRLHRSVLAAVLLRSWSLKPSIQSLEFHSYLVQKPRYKYFRFSGRHLEFFLLPVTSGSIGTSAVRFLDPENIGLAIGILMLSRLEAEIQVLTVLVSAILNLPTSGYIGQYRHQCHLVPGPRNHRFSRWNFVSILSRTVHKAFCSKSGMFKRVQRFYVCYRWRHHKVWHTV